MLNDSESKASEILYKHFKKTAKLIPDISDVEVESVKLNEVKAFEVDLNNDNKNEMYYNEKLSNAMMYFSYFNTKTR